MPHLTLWGLFVVASVVLLLTPSPAVLFIVARSGFRRLTSRLEIRPDGCRGYDQ
jgi:hypothetical protein